MTDASNETEWAADRKVGFAMGILLVGIVAALFFRNEPLSVKDAPTVQRGELIDNRLRDRDVSVYPDTTDPVSSDTQQQWTLPDLLDQYEQRDAGVALPIAPVTASDAQEHSGIQPDYCEQNPADSLRFRPPAVIDDSLISDSSPAESEDFLDEAASRRDGDDTKNARSYEEYTIRYGDTLSGIADKQLGSPGRYQDIYDANRDRMTSPDRLRVGTVIRIPRL